MKKDVTFSDADIIRFFCNNLTPAEQFNVWLFFSVVLPAYIQRETSKSSLFTILLALLRDRLTFGVIRAILNKVVDIDLKIAERLITSHFARQKGGRKLVRAALDCVESGGEFLNVLRANASLTR